jgi:hypothetical protein
MTRLWAGSGAEFMDCDPSNKARGDGDLSKDIYEFPWLENKFAQKEAPKEGYTPKDRRRLTHVLELYAR